MEPSRKRPREEELGGWVYASLKNPYDFMTRAALLIIL
jgi:hypothetical protein